jgi:hypothetical protein
MSEPIETTYVRYCFYDERLVEREVNGKVRKVWLSKYGLEEVTADADSRADAE